MRCCALSIPLNRIVVLIVSLVTTACLPGNMARAAEEAPPEIVEHVIPGTESGTDGNSPVGATSGGIGKAVDETHDRLEKNILRQAVRLDNFFGNIKTDTQQNTGFQIRWRNSLRAEEGGTFRFGSSLWASFLLSRINEKLRLVISGENEPDSFAPSLPEDPGNPGFDRTFRSARLVNTELRYGLYHSSTLDVSLGAGVRLIMPPEPFVRAGFHYTHRIDDSTLLSIKETLFANSTVGPGETTEFNLEKLLDTKTVVRWASSGTVSGSIRGLEWGSELSLMRELSAKSAITVTAGMYGNTAIDDVAGNYRISTRYRRNFFRPWLYYELEPEISWPRRDDGNFPTTFAFTVRLEVVFQGDSSGKKEDRKTH